MNSQTMIDALNSLEVTEWCGSGGELEYVMAENNEGNRKILLEAGFTKEQLSEATDGLDEEIDLVTLAVNYANNGRDRRMKAPNKYCDGCVWATVITREKVIVCPFVRCVKRYGFQRKVK